jgi:single-stranded DNA-binding protein
MDEITYPLPNMNTVTLAGRMGKSMGLLYRQDGKPMLKFTIIIEDTNVILNKTFTTVIPCELAGDRAERLAEELEAGDRVLITGRLAYRSNGDQATTSLGVYCHQAQRLGAPRLSGAA